MPPYLAFHPPEKNKRTRQVITSLPPWLPNEAMLMVVNLAALHNAAAKANVVGILAAVAAAERARSQALATSQMRYTKLDTWPPRKPAQ